MDGASDVLYLYCHYILYDSISKRDNIDNLCAVYVECGFSDGSNIKVTKKPICLLRVYKKNRSIYNLVSNQDRVFTRDFGSSDYKPD